MHFPDIAAAAAHAKRSFAGPIALVVVEDDVEIDSTLAHLDTLGFAHILAFCPADLHAVLPDLERVHRVDMAITPQDPLPQIANAMIKALPDTWFFACYNAEYLYYPFCEQRNVREMLSFMREERRSSVMSYVIDLYARDLTAHPNGVDRDTAHFDKTGYYALSRKDAAGEDLEQQFDIGGGLRWRFEEHIPASRQHANRVSFFQSRAGLEMLADRSFNLAEYNTVSCPWHNNLTATIASFRTAKALRRNPGSRDVINSFHWPQSEACVWTSQQFLDLGMMEPGQWF